MIGAKVHYPDFKTLSQTSLTQLWGQQEEFHMQYHAIAFPMSENGAYRMNNAAKKQAGFYSNPVFSWSPLLRTTVLFETLWNIN